MKKNDVKSDTNVFKSAVDNTVELKDGYCKGLQALKGNSLKVSVSKPQHLLGSVDIDDCTKGLYPNASRWDYAIGCKHPTPILAVWTISATFAPC